MIAQLDLPDTTRAELCQRHHIRRLALFGSQARGEQRPDSDVDLLVEFAPGYVPGLVQRPSKDDGLRPVAARYIAPVRPIRITWTVY